MISGRTETKDPLKKIFAIIDPFLTAETGCVLVDAARVGWLVGVAQLTAGGGGGATGAALLPRAVPVVERARLVATGREGGTGQHCRDWSGI